MKNILTGLLLMAAVPVIAAEKKESAAAFEKGKITIEAGVVVPYYFGNNLVGRDNASFQLGAQYQLSRLVNLSVQYTYCNSAGGSGTMTNTAGLATYSYDFRITTHAVLGIADFYWLNRNKMGLYSGLGIGYQKQQASGTFSDGVDHMSEIFGAAGGPAIQLRLIGLKANLAKGLGVYADLGFGYNGFFAGGLHYTFGGKK